LFGRCALSLSVAANTPKMSGFRLSGATKGGGGGGVGAGGPPTASAELTLFCTAKLAAGFLIAHPHLSSFFESAFHHRRRISAEFEHFFSQISKKKGA
jgi:hypothetical protein